MCESKELWEGTAAEIIVLKDMCDENGKEYEYADRRQELVFIGIHLKYTVIQKALDDCLLTDEEMALGPEKWQETMADKDKIYLYISDDSDVEDEEGEEDEENEGEESEDEEKASPIKKGINQFRDLVIVHAVGALANANLWILG